MTTFLTKDTDRSRRGALTANRTLAQAAIQLILAEPSIAAVLPNIYNEQQLSEFASAPDTPRLSAEEITEVQELYADNFGVKPETQPALASRTQALVPSAQQETKVSPLD